MTLYMGLQAKKQQTDSFYKRYSGLEYYRIKIYRRVFCIFPLGTELN